MRTPRLRRSPVVARAPASSRSSAPRAQYPALARRAPANPPALPDPAAEGGERPGGEAWGLWEDAQRSVLPSGLRLVTARLPRSGSVSVTVGLEAGSRFETEAQSG